MVIEGVNKFCYMVKALTERRSFYGGIL